MSHQSADQCGMRIRVSGIVQGVGFRYTTARQARRLGLHGWVRNRTDGSVEILVQGRPEDVGALLEWCRVGPPGAVVSSTEYREEPVDETLARFAIRH